MPESSHHGSEDIVKIIGSRANDALAGTGGRDAISGGDGADSLDGGDGADTLQGGPGGDTLAGGAGADSFVFLSGDLAAGTPDVITDFEGGIDRIAWTGASAPVLTRRAATPGCAGPTAPRSRWWAPPLPRSRRR
jgi:Ca2+-binding RTX toxin-like protein